MPNSELEFIVVMTTLPDRNQADQLAKILVAEQLAACVQIMPSMTSFYMWDGKLCQEHEHLLLIKTVAKNYDALVVKLRSQHPYEVPEIMALPVIAIEDNYALWVKAMCGQG
ncbi:divalent-cation tolerance protein CutA [Pseudanabaena mucicola]|uniref:Divalent-cation tolerance protein CutA n=1 Tax=Pseudanabaena mucicola FACHB-723 TaxID=2692860 RepID=A0ABR8A0H5_9CYAN|nr:divalent-cation tolerance protein CutA [Pseudanabaena mucicola]MBD2189339.1 divalent-cation tolerance protein CutA [Pseudanabaena mucicola FACHB-723]